MVRYGMAALSLVVLGSMIAIHQPATAEAESP